MHLSQSERLQLQREHLVLANYQKSQQQRAKKLPAAGGTDRPRDPWLDILANQQAEQERATGKNDP